MCQRLVQKMLETLEFDFTLYIVTIQTCPITLLAVIIGSNMGFHALTFARSRGRCWKPGPKAAVLNTSQGSWQMLMHWKTMFDHYYCIKSETFATFRVIYCTILFRHFTDVSRTQFPRAMLVLGPDTTHLVTAAIMWPRYRHIESCVAVH